MTTITTVPMPAGTYTTTAAVGFTETLVVGFDDTAVEGAAAGWEMCAVIEGVDTRDSQQVRLFRPGSIRFPAQDAALLWMATDSHGDGDPAPAVRVGTIERFGRDGDQIILAGRYLDTFEAAEFARLVESGDAGWPSIVVSDDDVIVSEEPAPDMGEGVDVMPDQRAEWIDGLLVNVCIVQTPAQEGTWIRPAATVPVDDAVEDEPVAVAASAGPLRPPRPWFNEPDMADGPTPWTVDESGRCYGMIGLKNECHSGFRDHCVTLPQGLDYAAFHRGGSVLCDDGTTLGIGHITLATGHADLSLNARDTVHHYDHTGYSGALVRAGENQWGTWAAGTVRADADELQRYALRAASPSGDWRKDASPWLLDVRKKLASDEYELLAILLVNVPGFGEVADQPRVAARVASGVLEALVAAGATRQGFAEARGSCGCDDHDVLTAAAATLRLLAPVALERVGERVGYPERLLARARLAEVASRLGG